DESGRVSGDVSASRERRRASRAVGLHRAPDSPRLLCVDWRSAADAGRTRYPRVCRAGDAAVLAWTATYGALTGSAGHSTPATTEAGGAGWRSRRTSPWRRL